MLEQFPYNLLSIISTFILVIYIKSISVTAERKKEKNQPSLEMIFLKKDFYFLKISGKNQSWHSSCVVSSVTSQVCWSLGKGLKWADIGGENSC